MKKFAIDEKKFEISTAKTFEFISNIPKTTTKLSLHGAELDKKSVSELIKFLSEAKFLNELDLSYISAPQVSVNRLSTKLENGSMISIIKSLPESLHTLNLQCAGILNTSTLLLNAIPNVRNLNIAQNKLTDKTIEDMIFNMKHLKLENLNIELNPMITQDPANNFANHICELKGRTQLKVEPDLYKFIFSVDSALKAQGIPNDLLENMVLVQQAQMKINKESKKKELDNSGLWQKCINNIYTDAYVIFNDQNELNILGVVDSSSSETE
jgi:hypothetical protein